MTVLHYVTYGVVLNYVAFTYGVSLHYVAFVLIFLYCIFFVFYYLFIYFSVN